MSGQLLRKRQSDTVFLSKLGAESPYPDRLFSNYVGPKLAAFNKHESSNQMKSQECAEKVGYRNVPEDVVIFREFCMCAVTLSDRSAKLTPQFLEED